MAVVSNKLYCVQASAQPGRPKIMKSLLCVNLQRIPCILV